MRGSTARAFRHQQNEAVTKATEIMSPAVEAALTNELKTRQRVEVLEERAESVYRVVDGLVKDPLTYRARLVVDRGFLGRLKWLLLGK